MKFHKTRSKTATLPQQAVWFFFANQSVISPLSATSHGYNDLTCQSKKRNTGSSMADRLEREIEELLDKIEHFPNPASRRSQALRNYFRQLGNAIGVRQRALAAQLGNISISQLLLMSFLMIFGSFFLKRFNPLMMQWVLYAGIILFVTSFAILMFSRSGEHKNKSHGRWRGRAIRENISQTSRIDRIKKWWNANRNRR